MNDHVLNGKSIERRETINTMGIGDFSIAALVAETKAEAQRLNDGGLKNGDFTVQITIRGRMDEIDKINARLDVSHYHYQSFDGNTQSAKGIEWEEVHGELRRRLTRDSALKRLAHMKEEPLA